jgi:hypothetical protein
VLSKAQFLFHCICVEIIICSSMADLRFLHGKRTSTATHVALRGNCSFLGTSTVGDITTGAIARDLVILADTST